MSRKDANRDAHVNTFVDVWGLVAIPKLEYANCLTQSSYFSSKIADMIFLVARGICTFTPV